MSAILAMCSCRLGGVCALAHGTEQCYLALPRTKIIAIVESADASRLPYTFIGATIFLVALLVTLFIIHSLVKRTRSGRKILRRVLNLVVRFYLVEEEDEAVVDAAAEKTEVKEGTVVEAKEEA